MCKNCHLWSVGEYKARLFAYNNSTLLKIPGGSILAPRGPWKPHTKLSAFFVAVRWLPLLCGVVTNNPCSLWRDICWSTLPAKPGTHLWHQDVPLKVYSFWFYYTCNRILPWKHNTKEKVYLTKETNLDTRVQQKNPSWDSNQQPSVHG